MVNVVMMNVIMLIAMAPMLLPLKVDSCSKGMQWQKKISCTNTPAYRSGDSM
jgi:hypothetical protein